MKLGDPQRGDVAVTGAEDEVLTITEAVRWLRNQASQHYPDKRFARRYRNQVDRFGSIHTPGNRWARSGGALARLDKTAFLAAPTASIRVARTMVQSSVPR